MPNEDSYHMATHYRFVAEEFAALARVLREALAQRPTPRGEPFHVGLDAVENISRRFTEAISDLTYHMSRLTPLVLSQDNVTRANVREAAAPIEEAVRDMASLYRQLWARPFPAGLERGQILFSVFMERVMEETLAISEKVVSVINNPAWAVKEYGSTTIKLDLILSGDEAERFAEWLNGVTMGLRQQCATMEQQRKETFWGFLLAFLLGSWWSGR